MGGGTYSSNMRSIRAEEKGYHTAPIHKVFTQQAEQKSHPEMRSQGIILREARDSENHPNSVPIIFALDLTGSMGHIPHHLIKDGLPKLVTSIIQAGIPDPQILFLGVGDHETDYYPLQVGQFESGDAEMDMWLTRTYLEGGGGGNGGESYSLAHYFAARCCQTDAWDKRKKKGILITIGDEPNLENYPNAAMKQITGNGDIKTFTDKEILAEALKQWDVYHIYPTQGWDRHNTIHYWKQLLGDRYFKVDDVETIVTRAIDIVLNHELGVKHDKYIAGIDPYDEGKDDPNDDPLDTQEIL